MPKMSPEINELAAALVAAQAELPVLTKDKTNPFFDSRYVPLEVVVPAALKVLSKHGLGVIQSVGRDGEQGTSLTTMLVHKSGQWYSDTQRLLITKLDPQKQGSAITYGRRYGLMAFIGLVAEEEDDDAEAATPKATPRKPSPRKAQTPTRPKGEERPDPRTEAPEPEPPPVESNAEPPTAYNGPTEAQIWMLRKILGQRWPDDDAAQVAAVRKLMPKATIDDGTAIHLGRITKSQASQLIDALLKLPAGA